jgi:8-oxo-dGTP diphosphatase
MPSVLKVALILIRDRKLLFARTKGRDVFFNVGGRPEIGEDDLTALRREVREETGTELRYDTIRYLRTFSAQAHVHAEGTLVVMRCYEAEVDGTLVPSSEIEELAWFTSADGARTTEAGRMVLAWCKEKNLID